MDMNAPFQNCSTVTFSKALLATNPRTLYKAELHILFVFWFYCKILMLELRWKRSFFAFYQCKSFESCPYHITKVTARLVDSHTTSFNVSKPQIWIILLQSFQVLSTCNSWKTVYQQIRKRSKLFFITEYFHIYRQTETVFTWVYKTKIARLAKSFKTMWSTRWND